MPYEGKQSLNLKFKIMQTFHCEPQITANFTQQITAHVVPEQ